MGKQTTQAEKVSLLRFALMSGGTGMEQTVAAQTTHASRTNNSPPGKKSFAARTNNSPPGKIKLAARQNKPCRPNK